MTPGFPLGLVPAGAPGAAARLGPLPWEGSLGPCTEPELSSQTGLGGNRGSASLELLLTSLDLYFPTCKMG